jgi:hypothetical protein
MALLPDAGIETIEDKLKTVLKLRRYRQRHPSFDAYGARVSRAARPSAIDDGDCRRLAA